MPNDCQIVLFSATFSDMVKEFAQRFAPRAHALSLKVQELSVDGIKQFYMDCKSETHKIEVLQALYGLLTIGQSIIFVAVIYIYMMISVFTNIARFTFDFNHSRTKYTEYKCAILCIREEKLLIYWLER